MEITRWFIYVKEPNKKRAKWVDCKGTLEEAKEAAKTTENFAYIRGCDDYCKHETEKIYI